MSSVYPSLEFGAAREDADICVILMHGLGADGHDFADVAKLLCGSAAPGKWRFVLPHAPEMAVTINMGMRMPAWYDILDLSQPRAVDWASVQKSHDAVEALLAREPAGKLVLAGFSQGAAMALHTGLRTKRPITGILMMSGYLLESEDHPCPKKKHEIPIGMFHGTGDEVVPMAAAEQSRKALVEAGFAPELKPYAGMGHGVCEEEIGDVFRWLEVNVAC